MRLENSNPPALDAGNVGAVQFETSEYEAVHGKVPRHAGWVFRPADADPCDFDSMVAIFGTLTDAKLELAPGLWVVCP